MAKNLNDLDKLGKDLIEQAKSSSLQMENEEAEKIKSIIDSMEEDFQAQKKMERKVEKNLAVQDSKEMILARAIFAKRKIKAGYKKVWKVVIMPAAPGDDFENALLGNSGKILKIAWGREVFLDEGFMEVLKDTKAKKITMDPNKENGDVKFYEEPQSYKWTSTGPYWKTPEEIVAFNSRKEDDKESYDG
jgi:hypothetical protein